MKSTLDGSRRERRESRGGASPWHETKTQPHWCLPPRWYPQPERGQAQVGPGSLWECPTCSLVWTSFGIWIDNDPDNWPRADLSIKPLFAVGRWRVADREIQLPRDRFGAELAWKTALAHISTQEDSYDWRGIHTLNSKLLRRLIEANGSEWRDVLD